MSHINQTRIDELLMMLWERHSLWLGEGVGPQDANQKAAKWVDVGDGEISQEEVLSVWETVNPSFHALLTRCAQNGD